MHSCPAVLKIDGPWFIERQRDMGSEDVQSAMSDVCLERAIDSNKLGNLGA